MRMCVDYRPVNRVTEEWRYPMADIQQILDDIGARRSNMFSTCDAYKGYWQVPIAPEDRAKTAFASPLGHLEFARMPFGLKTAPAHWYSRYELICKPLADTRAFMDDSCTTTRGFEDHVTALQQFFDAVFKSGLRLNPKKCHFFGDSAEFVGHHISAEGYRPLQNYIEAVQAAAPPKNPGEVRSFIGLAGYLRRFVPHFSTIAHPLTALTKKGVTWQWGEKEVHAFQELKRLLTEAPMLRFVNPARPIRVATDWSTTGIGAVMSQFDEENREYVCGYLSKTCTAAESRYSSFKGELLAVLWACERWRHYLGGRRFELVTDHKALEWLLTAKELPPSLARWVLRLDEFDIHVVHRPGAENLGPDYLSRHPVRRNDPAPQPAQVDAVCSLERAATPEGGAEDCSCNAAGANEGVAVLAYLTFAAEAAPSAPLPMPPSPVFLSMAVAECCIQLLAETTAVTENGCEEQWLTRVEAWAPASASVVEVPGAALVSRGRQAVLVAAALVPPDDEDGHWVNTPTATAAAVAAVDAQSGDKNEAAAAPGRLDPAEDLVLHAYLQHGTSAVTQMTPAERERVQHRAQRYRWDEPRPPWVPDGRLLRVFPSGATRIVPPLAERRGLIEQVHSSTGGMVHMGVQRTYSGLIHTYWWPGMYDQVAQVVRECPACDRQKATAEVRYPVLQPLPIRGLFYRVSFDLFGPLPISKRGNRYAMVSVEHLSRAIDVVAIPSKEAAHTAWVAKQAFSRYGAPAEAVTDCGTEWQGAFHAVLQDFHVDHRTTAGYHAQANGLAERVVQTVKSLLVRALSMATSSDEQLDWEDLLPGIVLAYNCSPQTSTKQAPYALLYGREPLLPVQAAARMRQEVDPDDPETAALDLAQRVEFLRSAVPMAMGNLEIAQHRDTLRYARVHGGGYAPVITRLQPGQLVYVRDHTATALQPGVKRVILQVVELRGSSVVLLGRDARTIVLSIHDVVPCHLPNVDLTLDPALRDATYDVPCEHCLEVTCTRSGPRAMLLCDSCSTGWHLGCLRHVQDVAPRAIPKGQWFCHRCIGIGRAPTTLLLTGEQQP